MSNIFLTRRGFLYQDRYAILCYLQHLLKKDIQRFYIDYPLEGKKSLDIKLMDSKSEEKVYEVKSGEQFKEKPKEIKEALVNLHLYSSKTSKTTLNLIIRKGFRNEISIYWNAILQLKRYRTLRSPVAQDALSQLQKLGLPKMDLHHFCQSLTLDDSFDDQKSGSADSFPDIADQILSKIKDLIGVFGLHESEFEWPNKLLMYELLHESAQFAGSETDLNPLYKKVIIDFLIRRKLVSDHYQYKSKSSKQAEETKIRETIESQYEEKFNQTVHKRLETLGDDSAGNEPK